MWAGGKTRLLKRFAPVWPDCSQVDHYLEPFLGGGAVFCWLHDEWARSGRGALPATLGDCNAELIGVLAAIQDDPDQFITDVSALAQGFLALPTPAGGGKAARKQWYYALRAAYWDAPSPAALYVLMRLGFNGIWQTCAASNGLFGTPAGLLTQTRLDQILDADLVHAWADALYGTTLHAGSYQDIPVPRTGNVLIYLDPPYRHSHTDYGTGFDDGALCDLLAWAVAQADWGCTVVLSNRTVEGDTFFADWLAEADAAGLATVTEIAVIYTAGRRRRTADGYLAMPATELLVVLPADPDGLARRRARTRARDRWLAARSDHSYWRLFRGRCGQAGHGA